MFILGTAGHIDHGKSSIIKRLTDIDPDRLPEEQERGMTIDIGFAFYDTPDGTRIGIVDVPGHERFVRNMISGVGGIDAVILVVAADDGWMPQSQEHFDIIRMLDTKFGLIALTKIDLVENSWIDLVEEDIREKVRGSFLEGAPVVRLSSTNGEGFDKLKDELNSLAGKVKRRQDIGKPRLYIDRSFVLPGLGGVVTGTMRDGSLSTGQEIGVFPEKRYGKVRTIQSHNEQVDSVNPGTRTSISTTGIDKVYLPRGGVVSIPRIVREFPEAPILTVDIEVLKESPIILENRRKLLMITGTTELEGEIRLYDKEALSPGEKGIIFFKPFEKVLAFIGDKFILRLPTPQITVGGGQVIDILEKMPRSKNFGNFKYLHKRKDLNIDNLIESELDKKTFVKKDRDFIFSICSQDSFDNKFEQMLEQGDLQEYSGLYYRAADLEPVTGSIVSSMTEYFEKHPHLDGIPIDRVSSVSGRRPEDLELILELMEAKGLIVKKGNRFDIPGREVTVRGDIKMAADNIEEELQKGAFSPPALKELLADDETRRQAFDYLVVSDKAVKTGSTLAFHREYWGKIVDNIKEILKEKNELAVGDLRDRIDSTRKYIVPILEETDRRKITMRTGDVRVKGDRFEKG